MYFQAYIYKHQTQVAKCKHIACEYGKGLQILHLAHTDTEGKRKGKEKRLETTKVEERSEFNAILCRCHLLQLQHCNTTCIFFHLALLHICKHACSAVHICGWGPFVAKRILRYKQFAMAENRRLMMHILCKSILFSANRTLFVAKCVNTSHFAMINVELAAKLQSRICEFSLSACALSSSLVLRRLLPRFCSWYRKGTPQSLVGRLRVVEGRVFNNLLS